MSRATLVIMAAGIGSRFGGGIKQLEPIGPNGEIIMDYSIYDAMQAGFDKVVFVIRKDLEKDFKEVIGNRIEKRIQVAYAFQELNDIPEKYQKKFSERTKPWGTGQAILCCKNVIDSPFLVINADDYYGKEAYRVAYNYLINGNMRNEKQLSAAMVGFVLENTLSENGGVTRGICKVDENHMLKTIVETHNIVKTSEGAAIVTDGECAESVDVKSAVSMNMWGLQPEFIRTLEDGFYQFLEQTPADQLTREYLLPTIIGNLLEQKAINVKVLESNDQWFGVTYKEDKEAVVNSIQKLIRSGMYPVNL